ncbi:MAG TPA: hypothetical protein DEW35_04140 [Ruminococcaceae bacterium]|nr:hypothetical protein [Oscillospiraceae bacterium]
MFKYSIIIPVYNAERYIEQAVDSILSQTYSDYEIILINDGSTDDSSKICHKYKDKYNDKIIVIDSENSGTSDARNLGLSVATGDYIGFLDNDDFWQKNDFLEKIDRQLTHSKADMLVYLCQLFDDRTKTIKPKKVRIKKVDIIGKSFYEQANLLLKNSVIESAVWEKFTKREVVYSTPELLFPSKTRNEDTDWTAKLLMKISSLDYYDEPVYAYRKGTDYAQTSKELKKSHLLDLMKVIKSNADTAKNVDPRNRKIVQKFLSYPFLVLLGQSGIFDSFEDFEQFFKEYCYLLRKPKFWYMKIFYIMIKIFGVAFTVRICGKIFKKLYPNVKHD